MKKIKLEHIDRLSRGRRSGANIGSRAVGHHLRAHERIHYEQALRKGYLELGDRDRENLWNLWEKVCIVKQIDFFVLIKQTARGEGIIYLNGQELRTDNLKTSKTLIKQMASEQAKTASMHSG